MVRSLSLLPLFRACSRRELTLISRNSTLAELPAGHVFVRETERCDELIVLVSGSAVAIRDGYADVILGPGDWWGDADLLAGARSSATVIARTKCVCLVLSRSEFLYLFDDAPMMRRRMVRSLATAAVTADRMHSSVV